jgi:hypothetical protein
MRHHIRDSKRMPVCLQCPKGENKQKENEKQIKTEQGKKPSPYTQSKLRGQQSDDQH